MRALLAILFLGFPATAATGARGDGGTAAGLRFETIDVYIDAGSRSLAAWQFEFRVTAGDAEVVGVEGGEHPAFNAAPYYDPAALKQGYLIVAAYDTGRNVPSGRTRVATLHLLVRGGADAAYDLSLDVAADRDGTSFDADLTFVKGAE